MIFLMLFFMLIVTTYVFGPFVLWRSVFVIVKAVITSREISHRERFALLGFIAKELIYIPPVVLLWWVDELLFSRYRSAKIAPPLFIISQPRSGTSFLLRTLAKDTDNFFTLRHLDWRVPSVAFWTVVDKLNMRRRLEAINYWPNTELGQLASKMHSHTMGSIETHGVFFEEKMFHHYFAFRRFPFPDVLERMERSFDLTLREKRKLVQGLKRAVQKHVHYHQCQKRWLTKENENVGVYRLAYELFPNAHFLCILREPQDFMRSFISASDASIRAKHGLDIDNIAGWSNANIAFRRDQAHDQIEFCRELKKIGAITYVTYKGFTSDIKGSLQRIYKDIDAEISPHFENYLDDLQVKQKKRSTGYSNTDDEILGFDDFANFVADITNTEVEPEHVKSNS